MTRANSRRQHAGGDWRVTVFDQWTDLILDGYTTPVRVDKPTVEMGDIAVHQWRQNLYTRTFFDENGDGVSQDNEPASPLCRPISAIATEVTPISTPPTWMVSPDSTRCSRIFNWYVVETDATRYKNTGTHVVYDAGGPVDGSAICGKPGIPACGTSTIGKHLARTMEDNSLPADLRVPGSVYCDNADCNGFSIANGPASSARAIFPQAESILPGCRATDGRDSSGRPASWSSARSPSPRARMAASADTSSTPRPARSMTRPCSSSSAGSRWCRMSP